ARKRNLNTETRRSRGKGVRKSEVRDQGSETKPSSSPAPGLDPGVAGAHSELWTGRCVGSQARPLRVECSWVAGPPDQVRGPAMTVIFCFLHLVPDFRLLNHGTCFNCPSGVRK